MKVCVVRDIKTGEVLTCYGSYSPNVDKARLYKRVSDARQSINYRQEKYHRKDTREVEVVVVDLTEAITNAINKTSLPLGTMVESNKGYRYYIIGFGLPNTYFISDFALEDSQLNRFGISRAIITWSSIRNGEWKIRE